MVWEIVTCSDYEKQKKDFGKKWPAEVKAVMANTVAVLEALNLESKPAQLSLFGFVHSGYPLGVLSIDESGHGKKTKPKALRLYVFPCEHEQLLYVMLFGEKAHQKTDVALCVDFVSKKIAAIQEGQSE